MESIIPPCRLHPVQRDGYIETPEMSWGKGTSPLKIQIKLESLWAEYLFLLHLTSVHPVNLEPALSSHLQ